MAKCRRSSHQPACAEVDGEVDEQEREEPPGAASVHEPAQASLGRGVRVEACAAMSFSVTAIPLACSVSGRVPSAVTTLPCGDAGVPGGSGCLGGPLVWAASLAAEVWASGRA